jgi:GPH family glycoside/pentoside/hexuronide:cation symporter
VANQVQTPEALEGILLTSTIIPIIFLVLAFVDICFYGLDDKRYHQIITELEQRHQQENHSTDDGQLAASTL